MTTASEFAHGVRDQHERKRLGQYFTGPRLASLLAHLARAGDARSVVDPMVGLGDMLVASGAIGGGAEGLFGIEIDPAAAREAEAALARFNSSVRAADAFSPSSWPEATSSWDLVITNPPYVRYQLQTQQGRGEVATPSAMAVRTGLVEIVGASRAMTDRERDCFIALASGYGGLADLAVPSWILCAAKVSLGGRLALVVPDTWLSRDYAGPSVYLLRRFFELEAVVEDADAAWFPNALVRTTLVIARRVEDRGSAIVPGPLPYLAVRLSRHAADGRSMVGGLYPRAENPDASFTDVATELRLQGGRVTSPAMSAEVLQDQSLLDLLTRHASAKWFRACESRLVKASAAPRRATVPDALKQLVAMSGLELCTLEDHGWQVGQGLRTGANTFFYVDQPPGFPDGIVVGRAFGDERTLAAPPAGLLPVVRRQQECRDSFSLDGLSGRVLALHDYALSEDIDRAQFAGFSVPYMALPEGLAEYVREAAEFNIGDIHSPKFFPALSAVTTNVRAGDRSSPGRLPRFWYQLPPLAPRHRPALLIPRINYNRARCLANPNQRYVVDANFSSLWMRTSNALSTPAMLALFNSTWVALALERLGTVLGGGALKVEAAQIVRLPVPCLSGGALDEIERLGAALTGRGAFAAKALIHEIDDVVFASSKTAGSQAREMLRAHVKGRMPERIATREPS